jgi:hypothetical protein
MWNDDTPILDKQYCGGRTIGDGPYCPHHHAIAFLPKEVRSEKSDDFSSRFDEASFTGTYRPELSSPRAATAELAAEYEKLGRLAAATSAARLVSRDAQQERVPLEGVRRGGSEPVDRADLPAKQHTKSSDFNRFGDAVTTPMPTPIPLPPQPQPQEPSREPAPATSVRAGEFRDTLGELGLSHTQFARLLGYAPRTVRHWSFGSRPIPRETRILMQLARAGKISVGDIEAAAAA